MTIIVYKTVLGRYELCEIARDTGDGYSIIFEHPIDAKLVIADRVYSVRRGLCNIEESALRDGEITPRLVTSCGVNTIEPFIVSGGAIIKKQPDAEYLRRTVRITQELFDRVAALEAEVGALKNKTEQKIEF